MKFNFLYQFCRIVLLKTLLSLKPIRAKYSSALFYKMQSHAEFCQLIELFKYDLMSIREF